MQYEALHSSHSSMESIFSRANSNETDLRVSPLEGHCQPILQYPQRMANLFTQMSITKEEIYFTTKQKGFLDSVFLLR